jgi:hypothetical protein
MNIKAKLTLARQKGFNNVQIAVGILVAVVTMLGSLGSYVYVSQAKVNNEISELNDLQSNTVRYGAAISSAFTSSNMTLAILSGINFFPSSRVSGSSTTPVVSNQWGGAITVAVGTINSSGDSIAFSYTGVPDYACKEIATKVDNIASIITVNSVVVKSNGSASSAATVGTACGSTGNTNNNTMIYTISK